MKKYLFIIMSALVLANGALFAQNTAQSETKTEDAAEGTVKEKSGTWPSFMTTKDADVRTGFAKERLVEIGIANVNFGFSNSWFKIGDLADFVLSIFSGGKSYDIEDFLNKGAMAVEFGTDSKPLYARVKIGSLFTLDLATRFESAIQANVTQEAIDTLKKLNDAKKNPSGLTPSDLDKLGGDVYLAGNTYASLDIGLEKTFLNNKLWVRGGPAIFVPVLYMPKTEVHLKSTEDGNYYMLNSPEVQIRSWKLQSNSLSAGADLELEARYAIWPVLDAGASVRNIPVIPAVMKNRAGYQFELDFKVPKTMSGSSRDVKMDFTFKEDSSDNDNKKVWRPTRFDFYVLVKPFKTNFLIIQPDAGFSLNTVAANSTFNWGVKAQLNLPLVMLSAGSSCFEQVYNQFVQANFHAGIFEPIVGLSLRGPSFVSSWTAGGLGAVVGFKVLL